MAKKSTDELAVGVIRGARISVYDWGRVARDSTYGVAVYVRSSK
jgi:hypothetical protein